MMRAGSTRHVARSGATALLLLAVVAAALAVAGCGRFRRAGYGTVATMDTRQVERLRRIATRDMACPRGDIVIVPMTQNAVELRGCSRIREYSFVCRRGRRCNWQPMTPAAMLATRDLACPLDAMSVSGPTASTRDLVGCGRVGRYALACLEDSVCRWNLLAPVAPNVVAAPPPAYSGTYAAPPVTAAPVTGPAVSSEQIPPPPGASVHVEVQVSPGAEQVPPPPQGSTAP